MIDSSLLGMYGCALDNSQINKFGFTSVPYYSVTVIGVFQESMRV